jgi:predicted ATPase
MYNIRCFEDTGDLIYSRKINLLLGVNNSGKTSLIKGLLAFQGLGFQDNDFRENSNSIFAELECVYDEFTNDNLQIRYGQRGSPNPLSIRLNYLNEGAVARPPGEVAVGSPNDQVFPSLRPHHLFVPFLAKRKTTNLTQQVNRDVQSAVTGTFEYLVSRIDSLANFGHPNHEAFKAAILEVVGVPITTRASQHGKMAGAYINANNFIELSQMGDGITELVALIVELVLEKGKVFVVEEPETSLHPSALKAILNLIKAASEFNQFFITTHSNIVLAELACDSNCEIFKVSRQSSEIGATSIVEKISHDDVESRRALMAELGYELSDFGLFDAWIIFEESSAESIYNQILVPLFAPDLQGRLRSFSAGGAGGVADKFHLFLTLLTFVHLEPVYAGRVWVAADGDQAGLEAIEVVRARFPRIAHDHLINFAEGQFESYYPEQFRLRAEEFPRLENKRARQLAKASLLREVLLWHKANPEQSKAHWEASAAEHIAILRMISESIQ